MSYTVTEFDRLVIKALQIDLPFEFINVIGDRYSHSAEKLITAVESWKKGCKTIH